MSRNNGHVVSSILSFSKRLALVVSTFIIAFSVLTPKVPKVAAATTTAAARVSFTFDDGLHSAYSLAAPTLAKYGFSGTNYVTTGCIGMTTTPNTCAADASVSYMTWAEVNSLRTTYNWEIGSHTVTHPLLASTSDEQPTVPTQAQIVSELSQSRDAILANTGVAPVSFATPYGDWVTSTITQIAKFYSSHRGFADVGYNTFPNNDYLLYDQQVQSGVSVANVKSYIDAAKANNQWLILTFHEIKAAGTASTDPEDYQYDVNDLDQIAAYVKSLNIPVMNVGDANSGGTNLLNGGSFDTALSSNTADTTVWSTDSPTTIKQDTANNGSYPSSQNSVSLTGSTANAHLFSPRVTVDSTKKYIIKNFLNVTAMTVGTGHEVAYYIDEYDAAGTYLQSQYKKSEASAFIESLNFEYVPTSATVKQARLQIVATANSGVKAYIDNVQWIDGSGGLGGGSKAGDVNSDNAVDALDLSAILANWNKTAATKAQGDLNADGTVDALDLSTLLGNWGK